ncbi:hypothetical protein UFOVP1313_35 [uncultured Caudovirales phage]|uniref:Uncharacterized protein n=1 Tax=uncultured Caudovirales phage TaxID=2100421 RepID=A0A6J5RW72_9CAUD|nr:hypothetical protein UFOVP1313_35 [uncultured Caudovirales phage]
MEQTRRDLFVCGECGCVLDDVKSALASRDEQISILSDDVLNAERELRSKRAQIKALKRDQDARLRDEPTYDKAMDVLDHWKSVCSPNARELGGKRLENVIARLKGQYTVAELKQAADGYAQKPFVVNSRRSSEGHRENWYADAELIYRDAQKVDAGIRMAQSVNEPRTPQNTTLTIREAREWVLDQLDSRFPGAALYDKQMDWWVSPCPVCLRAHNSLKILMRDKKPWLYCDECNADGPRIAEALR